MKIKIRNILSWIWEISFVILNLLLLKYDNVIVFVIPFFSYFVQTQGLRAGQDVAKKGIGFIEVSQCHLPSYYISCRA